MQVALIFLSALADRQLIANAAKRFGAKQVSSEGPVLVCKISDLQIASRLAGIPGIDNVAMARQVPRGFSRVVGAIVEAVSKAVMPGERFYVKAILAAKADYVERDIEFASAGALVEKLAKANALPAKSEPEADCVILAVVGKRSAYVCVRGKT